MSWISFSSTDHVSGIELGTRWTINNKTQPVHLGVLYQHEEVSTCQDKRGKEFQKLSVDAVLTESLLNKQM